MQAIKITDGRTSLWQWDTGVRIKVYGCTDVDQMHFVTPGGIISRELLDGECGVPDMALKTDGLLKMYAFDRTENGGVTRCDFLLMVKARPKPADYIDPPDEYDNLEELAKRVAPLIPGGGGSVTPEQIGAAVEEYLAENPVEGEPGPPGPQGERGEQGPPGADGSDATVTAANVTAALGYTPADKETVESLSKEIDELPNIQETSESNSDLDVTDAAGNVLMRLADGNIKTKFFDSGNRPGRQEMEIDLSAYTPISYNIEGLITWTYDNTYRGILIPASRLAHTNRFFSGTYKMRFAFLRSGNISANVVPDYCLGTGLITLSPGQSKYYALPCDCAYVYVYISDGTFFGQMGILRMADNFDTFATMRNAEKPAFLASVEQSLLTAKHMNSGVVRDFVGSNVSDNLLTFAHTSDLHTDPTNYTRFLNLLNEHDSIIDFGIVTGDLIDAGQPQEFETMIGCESVLNGNVPLYKCVGNHDASTSFTDLHAAYKPGSDDGSLYFSKDFSAQKIKLIILNQYDNTNGATLGNTGHYSQAQIDWFITQLQDAITNGLSVIVAMHSMAEAGWPKYNKEGFYQQVLGNMYAPVNSGPIISDIINAFKHKGTLTKTYTYTDGDGSINVSATFNGYGKFVCYVCGHEHVDVIGYSSIYPDQLICMVQAGVIECTMRPESEAHWQSKYDTPRIANTVTADSINVYSIDTVQKLVKVLKVGSTVTDKFETRSFAVFGY